MKKFLFAVLALTSLSSMAATLECKVVNPDETIYNIKELKVEVKAGPQQYLIREDKIAGNVYRAYLEQSADNTWFLNKYFVESDGNEEIKAEIAMVCELK